MKYHKKLKRTDLEKYSWQQLLMMAASEFSRADSLRKGAEMTNCLMRAKELLGIIEIDPSIPQASGLKLAGMINKLIKPSALTPKALYDQSMALAS